MKGKEFVKGVFDTLRVDGQVEYSSETGYFDWYDTKESGQLLNYQNTTFATYKDKLAHAFYT